MTVRKIILITYLLLLGLTSNVWTAEHVVSQRDKHFVIDGKAVEQLNIKAGDVVRFKNDDAFFHSIFSESAINTFKLGRYTTGESEAVKFEKKGTVEVECGIHRSMYLEVHVK